LNKPVELDPAGRAERTKRLWCVLMREKKLYCMNLQ